MSETRRASGDIASAYAALVGGFYLVYAILALLLTGSRIGDATGNDLWIFTVSPLTGILALAAALTAIPAATRPRAARLYAGVAGACFVAWGAACLLTGDSADPAFAGTTPNVTLYLVTGIVGIASAAAPAWRAGDVAASAAGDPDD